MFYSRLRFRERRSGYVRSCSSGQSIADEDARYFFRTRGRCPLRGLATRWAVVGPGPVPRPQSTRLSKHGSPGALLSLREVADAPLTRDIHPHERRAAARACRPGPSVTPRQKALSMTPLTHCSSEPLRDYMYSSTHTRQRSHRRNCCLSVVYQLLEELGALIDDEPSRVSSRSRRALPVTMMTLSPSGTRRRQRNAAPLKRAPSPSCWRM